MSTITRKSIQVGGEELVIETGKMARLANGSVTVRYGETIVLCTATASPKADYSKGWFPLFVEYREQMYSAGKIPGGFFRREGRPGAASRSTVPWPASGWRSSTASTWSTRPSRSWSGARWTW
jgi:polyribonucleotide nucleotidyltransferase